MGDIMTFPASSHILVVDDMMTMRKLLAASLRELGYQNIEEAEDGEQAWKKILNSTDAFQLIISDWNMPHMSGFQLLQKCKEDQRYQLIPFIMLTAEAEQHQVLEAVRLGVSSYVIKPFTPRILQEKLARAYKSQS